MRRTVLILSFFPAFYPPSSGGEVRLYQIYKHVSKHFRVVVISSSHFAADDLRIVHDDDFIEYRLGKPSEYYDTQAAVSEMSSGGDISAISVALCSGFPQRFHEHYFREYDSSDIVIHDSPFMTNYDLMLGIDNKPRIYNAYNAEYSLYQALHPGEQSAPLLRYVKSIESQLIRQSSMVCYCSETDEALLDDLTPDHRWPRCYVPNGTHRAPTTAAFDGNRRLIFIGSGHFPNVHAAAFIVDVLADRLPDFELHVVGGCRPVGRPKRNVTCHGRISDSELDHLLGTSSIALNPMASGAGSNLKIFDYMMEGLPIVSTAFGMRGTGAVPDRHFVLAALEDFPDEIRRLSDDVGRCERIRTEALHLVQREHSWATIAHRVVVEINKCIDRYVNSPRPRIYLALNDYDVSSGFGGGVSRIVGLHANLARRAKTVLLCLHDGSLIEKTAYSDAYVVIKIPKARSHLSNEISINGMFWISASDIISFKHAPANNVLRLLFKELSRMSYCVILEHPYMAGLLDGYRGRTVYASHNSEWALKGEMLRHHPRADELVQLAREAERLALTKADLVVGVSESDLASILRLDARSCPASILVRNGAPPAADGWAAVALDGFRDELDNVVFLGSAHQPNVEGLHFIESMAPQLPNIIFHIVGAVGGALKNASRSNVKVWGQVSAETKSAILMRAKIAINPVVSGGGSNVKLSDYMAHGLRVVTVREGIRGYPKDVEDYCYIASLDDFPNAIRLALGDAAARRDAHAVTHYFDQHLSMRNVAETFSKAIEGLTKRRKKILFVTYRFTEPQLGGAEAYMLKLLRVLDDSDDYDIHVVSPSVGRISDVSRFSCTYGTSDPYGWPVPFKNVTGQRFDLTKPRADRTADFWLAQAQFEDLCVAEMLEANLASPADGAVLMPGWHRREVGADGSVARWTTNKASIHVGAAKSIRIVGWSPFVTEMVVDSGRSSRSFKVSEGFDVTLDCDSDTVVVRAEGRQLFGEDKRILAIRMTHVEVYCGNLIERATMFETVRTKPAAVIAMIYERAAKGSRWLKDLSLSDHRGPCSDDMDVWMRDHVEEFDLLITHNVVFRPATQALKVTKAHDIPSVFVPHFHLEDDFYYFKDATEAVGNASVTLVTPRAACDFLSATTEGNIVYHGPGIDAGEFAEASLQAGRAAFRALRNSGRQFFLMLGRKTSAKGYRDVIEAYRQHFKSPAAFDIVMIGPDEDQQALDVPGVMFFGQQSREIVIGALADAIALINMSVSESFGMVILEAWMAGAPVIVNGECAAFQDLVEDGTNGYLVKTSDELARSMNILFENRTMRDRLAQAGARRSREFLWDKVGSTFLNVVRATCK